LTMTLPIVMAGHSRPKDGVAEPVLGLAEGKTRGLAYVPAIHAFGIMGSKAWMPATSAGMTGLQSDTKRRRIVV